MEYNSFKNAVFIGLIMYIHTKHLIHTLSDLSLRWKYHIQISIIVDALIISIYFVPLHFVFCLEMQGVKVILHHVHSPKCTVTDKSVVIFYSHI